MQVPELVINSDARESEIIPTRKFISHEEQKEILFSEWKEGKITSNTIDLLSVAVPESFDRYDVETAEQREFEAYMQGLVEKLLTSEFVQKYQFIDSKKIPKFRFLIQDTGNRDLNASILKVSNPPTIFFTKALLLELISTGKEDNLAAILAHELTHFLIDSSENSKVEESIAYALPTFLLYFAGYQHTAAMESYNLVSKNNRFGEIIKYFDVHPGPSMSKRIIEDSEGILAQFLNRKQRDFESIRVTEAIRFPEELGKLVEKFKYINPVEQDFNSADISTRPYREDGSGSHRREIREEVIEKIDFIVENIDRWVDIHGNTVGDVAVYTRVAKLSEIINHCFRRYAELDITSLDLGKLVDKVLVSNIPINIDEMFDMYTSRQINSNIEKYFIRSKLCTTDGSETLNGIKNSFLGFFEVMREPKGKELESVCELAKSLLDSVTKVNIIHRNKLRKFDFGDIPNLPTNVYLGGEVFDVWQKRHEARINGMPEPDGIKPPWDELVWFALQEHAQNGGTSIKEALEIVGIMDPRLEGILNNNDISGFKYSRLGYPEIIQDDNGRIIGTYKTGSDYYSSYGVVGRNETVSSRRQLFMEATRDNVLELKHCEREVLEAFGNVDSPEEMKDLITKYPFYFAFSNAFVGGAGSEVSEIYQKDVSVAFVSRLEELLTIEPDKWSKFVKEIFVRDFDLEEKLGKATANNVSLMGLTRKLQNNFLDNPLSGKHDHIYVRLKDSYDSEEVKIYVPEEMGMPVDHPYVRFVLDHTEAVGSGEPLFSLSELLTVLDKTVPLQVKEKEGNDVIPPKILGGIELYALYTGDEDEPVSSDRLLKRLNKLRSYRPSVVYPVGFNSEVVGGEWSSRFLFQFAKNDVYQFLTTHKKEYVSSRTLDECYRVAASKVGGSFSIHHTDDYLEEELEDLVKEQFLVNAEIDLSGKDVEWDELAESYVLYESKGFFHDNPHLRGEGYDKIVVEKLKSMEDGNDFESLRKFTENILFNCNVQSPFVREALIEGWGIAVNNEFGVDPFNAFEELPSTSEQSKYQESVMELVSLLIDRLGDKPVLLRLMAEELQNSLETQSLLTKNISFEVNKVIKDGFASQGSAGGPLAEFGLDYIVSHEKTRLATIDLLTGQLTDSRLEAFVDLLDVRRKAAMMEDESDIDVWIRGLLKNPVEVGVAYFTKNIDLSDRVQRAILKDKLKNTYNNFWEAPIEMRSYYMSLIAFPEENLRNRDELKMDSDKLVGYVLDKILPLTHLGPEEDNVSRYSQYGRDLILSYLDGASRSEQRLLLSGMMTSAREMGESTPRDESNIGKALATVLSNMGAAGVKLAQAIHSYPDTPTPIRKGMGTVKGSANLPTRAEMFARLEIVLLGSDRVDKPDLRKVGKSLGAGAYQYTFVANLNKPIDGIDNVALTILREQVFDYASNEFKKIQDTLKKFVVRRNSAGDVLSGGLISSLDKIVAQAKKSARLETDYNTGRVQAEMMRSQYENQVVRVKNKRVHFRTVRWLVDGSRKVPRLGGEDIEAYKVASVAEGKSFNKFCETATLDDIRTLGVALQVSEDKIFLSGGHFDHDRHGENFHVLKIENDTEIEGVMYKNGDFVVTHYDLGAVNVELPTRNERCLVGELIADALIRTFTRGEDMRDVIVEELTKKINENDYGTGYLSSLLRGLLARGDFLTRMNRADVIESEKLLLRPGVIDKEIFKALTSRLALHLVRGLKKRIYEIRV